MVSGFDFTAMHEADTAVFIPDRVYSYISDG
jgi:hypothetical protein